ncbi:MAG: HEAT repeat domain-containing protein [Dehalococcoidia bacterium]|nr:HEAT repeat domain-containing protein [Dehalococcoidia bacterium]
MSLTDDIKDYALDLGYFAVGVTTADPFPEYAKELETRYEMYRWAIDTGYRIGRCVDPKNFLPNAKSIVVTVYDYAQQGFPPELVGKIGRMYLSRSFLPPSGHIGRVRVQLMHEFLEKNGCSVGPRRGVISGVPERAAATRAGLTWVGNNTFAIASGPGSFIILNSFIVDVDLEYDSPHKTKGCPADCRRCIEACPTGAIFEKGKIDPRRCVSFLNFGTTQPDTCYIPTELREKIGTSIHGCDLCQEACEHNQARLKATLPVDPYLAKKAREFDLNKMLNATDGYVANVLSPILHRYIGQKSLLQRNAAIALGNMGNADAIPHLASALDDPEEVVRGHAAWALGRIGGKRAKDILELRLIGETGPRARQEIIDAMNRCR